jgi:hypothetical protein
MPRTLSLERQREFDELMAYVSFWATHAKQVSPDDPVHPANVVLGVVQQFGKSKALEGVRQAANDTVETMRDWPPSAVSVLDAALLEAKIVTASEMRRRFSASLRHVLKRGKIRTETEYHLVKSIVVDLDSQAVEEGRARLEAMLAAYEGEA